jgi:hypothetical protein
MKVKLLLLFIGLIISSKINAQSKFPFENEIEAFKKMDSVSFPPKNAILFIGSSSIRKWTDLEFRFGGQPIIRRGVGGCELWQLVSFYTPYILFPYHPRKIFIYAGENDIASGKSSQFVLQQFQQLWEMIRKQLPDATIYFMSIKAAPSRAKYYSEFASANQLVKNYLAGKPKSFYIYLNAAIQKPNTTTPDSSLFESDYIHLNKKGYDLWQKVLVPYVK